MNYQEFFETALQLVGRSVEFVTDKDQSPIRGKVLNAMFDSVLIETAAGKRVVRFTDLLTLVPVLP